MKTLEKIMKILRKHQKEIQERFYVKEIKLFGSFVRGEQKKTSDIDVLVDFDKPVSLLHIIALENFLSDILGRKVDVIPKKNIRKELKDSILKEAIPL